MDIRESAQDYLETILILLEKKKCVKSIDVAKEMNVTKQSVHRAIKNLKEEEYINVDEKGHITFNEKGEIIAKETYEKHNILASFFMMLNVPKDIAFTDACKIEHDISKESFSAIKEIVNSNGELLKNLKKDK